MNKLGKNRISIIVAIIIVTVGCATRSVNDEADTSNKPATISSPTVVKSIADVAAIENGWSVNSRDLSNGKDVNGELYTKQYTGKAASRAIELKSASYMESTCKQSVKKDNAKPLIESAYLSLGVDIKPEILTTITSKITKEDLKNIEVTNCKPTSPEKTFAECECSLSYKVDGGKKAMIEKVMPK